MGIRWRLEYSGGKYPPTCPYFNAAMYNAVEIGD
jgi:hypothetical protein